MKSVADDVRREQREHIRSLSPAQRIALMQRLYEDGLEIYIAGQKVSREEAIARIRRSRQRGRRSSRSVQE